jgi:nitrogen regulatory protein PII
MKVLFFVLNKPEKLDDVLVEFVNRNINGATVIDSAGMARILCHKHDNDEIPFLGSIRAYLYPEREKSNLIITVIEDHQLDGAIEAIELVVGDLSKKDTGIVFSVPIDFVKGIYKSGK